MSATCHLFSEHDDLRITADAEGAVWIRGKHLAVSLTLDAKDRLAMRAALDAVTSSESRPAPQIIHGNRDIHDPAMQIEAAEVNLRG